MVELIKLSKIDFDTFKSWITNKDDLFSFAGSILKYPVTDEQLLSYTNESQRVVYKVVLLESNTMIGNAELNFENPLPRLSRILIDNIAYRKKGLGRIIVGKMLEKLFTDYDFQQADLNVFDWNKSAIKCYESVGFIINPDVVYKHNYKDEIRTAINMTISKKDWIKNKTKILQ